MTSTTVGEDYRRLAWRCGGRNGRYRGGGGRRALFILLLLLPRLFVLCDLHLCFFLVAFLVARALMDFAVPLDSLLII